MIYAKRMTSEMEEDFVVFMLGMRINKVWKIHKWLPVALSLFKMMKELKQHPELGLLGHHQWVGRTTIMVQYWKSFDDLEAYAKNQTAVHLPIWTEFNRKVGQSGDVGIWHETYLSGKHRYECVYNNMPKFGLGKIGHHVEAKGSYKNARSRINS